MEVEGKNGSTEARSTATKIRNPIRQNRIEHLKWRELHVKPSSFHGSWSTRVYERNGSVVKGREAEPNKTNIRSKNGGKITSPLRNMEVESKNSNTEAPTPSTQQGPVNGGQAQEYVLSSAHTVGHDSWQQVGLMLVASFNCGYILTFSNLMLVPLGWTWGIICLFVVGFFTAYANWLLAGFHFINGQRFIRYRDLMGFLYGRQMFYITWVFQFLTLLLGNMGFILLGGRALKEINSEFTDSTLRLQYFIIITGATCFIFSFLVPTISAMGRWLGVSSVLTLTYIVILVVVLVNDGKSNKNRDYEISGSKVGKVFNAFGAISAIIVCNSSGIVLEIQSTLRRPAIQNMRKALYVQYSVGLAFYYGVSIVGYWAYGSTVSEYLPKELSGPKWVKVLINSTVFVQSIISQHVSSSFI
ncbi:hypothetical protein F0562_024338 [Nyssa sinensis]|uniref:Amino acid transporter transmembrane domain-containing protein n=1 Tax=Nyssa sinensis TaxID=561372 RepID=A0A5J5BCF0_9ASTE|nr:hypothetical protein F0562_024338 [Nyssa sinensis]